MKLRPFSACEIPLVVPSQLLADLRSPGVWHPLPLGYFMGTYVASKEDSTVEKVSRTGVPEEWQGRSITRNDPRNRQWIHSGCANGF